MYTKLISTKALLLIFAFLISTTFAFAQSLSAHQLIANYPFVSDANDATNNHSAATISNTTYAQGGIYSNGIYIGNNPAGSVIKTPQISDFEIANFIMKLDFKAEEVGYPILVCGDSWRWLSAYTNASDSTLELRVSKVDGFDQVVYTSFKVLPSVWYNLGVTFDSTAKTLGVYVDNNQIAMETLNANIQHQDDFDFGNENGGAGTTFKGYWRNLQLYKTSTTNFVQVKEASLNAKIFPNPIENQARLTVDSRFSTLYASLYSTDGRLLEQKRVENGLLDWNLEGYTPGIYYLHLVADDKKGGEVIQLIKN